MTISLSPPRSTGLPGRSSIAGGSQTSRHRAAVQPHSAAPSCSLKARPAPHPAPAPSWEELLGQR